jgi:hypothetical protein
MATLVKFTLEYHADRPAVHPGCCNRNGKQKGLTDFPEFFEMIE